MTPPLTASELRRRPTEQSVAGRRLAAAYAARAARALCPSPRTVILYGSVARGEARRHSDVDVLVIAEGLPAHWFDRLEQLARLRADGESRLQVLGYTPEEFETMLAGRHLTALEALDHGIVLAGSAAWVERLRQRLDELKAAGWQRTPGGWYRDLPQDQQSP